MSIERQQADVGANRLVFDTLAACAKDEFLFILLDLTMPVMGGFEFLKELRQSGNVTPVVFMTAHSEVERILSAVHFGVVDYLIKPFGFEAFTQKLPIFMELGRKRWTLEKMIQTEVSNPVVKAIKDWERTIELLRLRNFKVSST